MSDDRVAPEALRAVWQRLGESWDDVSRHDAFVTLVAQHRCFVWAAARYRERAGDPIADRQLARLREVATDTLMPRSATPRNAPARRGLGVFGLLGVLLASLFAIAALGYLYASCQYDDQAKPIPPPRGEWKR